MGAPKGNKYAEGCETSGQPKCFSTPGEWLNAVNSYFDWCDNNPWMKNEALKSGVDAGKIIQIPTQRPYLIEGLCNYLGISLQTFYNYESKDEYKEYFEISKYARNRIVNQNLEGGYVGAFDSGLVARKLGLIDKKEVEANTTLKIQELPKEKISELIEKL